MTTRPAPAPIQFAPRDEVAARPVVVATLGDTELTVNANAPAEELLDFLDDVEAVGDLVASHRYVKQALGADQYQTLRGWKLTQSEWARLGAHIIDIGTGAVFGMGDHLDPADLIQHVDELVDAIRPDAE
jgi:hypothetical protein